MSKSFPISWYVTCISILSFYNSFIIHNFFKIFLHCLGFSFYTFDFFKISGNMLADVDIIDVSLVLSFSLSSLKTFWNVSSIIPLSDIFKISAWNVNLGSCFCVYKISFFFILKFPPIISFLIGSTSPIPTKVFDLLYFSKFFKSWCSKFISFLNPCKMFLDWILI